MVRIGTLCSDQFSLSGGGFATCSLGRSFGQQFNDKVVIVRVESLVSVELPSRWENNLVAVRFVQQFETVQVGHLTRYKLSDSLVIFKALLVSGVFLFLFGIGISKVDFERFVSEDT